jgi:hypothetical protein
MKAPRSLPLRLARAAVVALALAAPAGASGQSSVLFTFAALGDVPYNEEEEARFPDFIGELNREKLAFVVHVGDLKGAASACTDELYLERRRWFGLSHHPLAYLPGDNDWLDCTRSLFDAREPRERLQKLRAVFFGSGSGLGQAPLDAVRQADLSPHHAFPEHLRWTHQGVLFVTLNVPGPDNNARDPVEHAPRAAAISDWLADSFRLARERRLRAVAVLMHASPWSRSGKPRRAFASLLTQLAHETRRFARPVLLVHGDEHHYRVDRPLLDPDRNAPLPDFTRVEVFGSPAMNWVRVRVSEDAGRIRFFVTPGS